MTYDSYVVVRVVQFVQEERRKDGNTFNVKLDHLDGCVGLGYVSFEHQDECADDTPLACDIIRRWIRNKRVGTSVFARVHGFCRRRRFVIHWSVLIKSILKVAPNTPRREITARIPIPISRADVASLQFSISYDDIAIGNSMTQGI